MRQQLILLNHRGDKQGEPKRARKMLEDIGCPWDFCRVSKGVAAVNSNNVRVLYHIVQMVSFLCHFPYFHIIPLKSASRFRPTLYITPVINTALLVRRQVPLKFETSIFCHLYVR